MLIRTHLAAAVFAIVLFLPYINGLIGKVIFAIVLLVATFIPDIDTGFSTLGKMKGFRFLQFFVRHRGWIHSFLPAVVLALVFTIVFPVLTLPFFLGYSLHIFLDSFTMDGVMPFWPYKKASRGFLKTGSYIETVIFIFFILGDIGLGIYRVFNWF